MNDEYPRVNVLALVVAFVGWLVVRVGYWIRPYDMLADRRRWFWQPRQRCGFTHVPAEVMVELLATVERRRTTES